MEACARVASKYMNSIVIISEDNDNNSEHGSCDGDETERSTESRREKQRTVNHSEQTMWEMDGFSTVLKHSDKVQKDSE